MLRKSLVLALAGVALAAAPATAQQHETRTTGVSYDDLDLSSEEGRDELDRRIDRAAKEVCGMGERQTGSNMSSRESRSCYRDAKRQLNDHFAEVIRENQLGG